MIQLSRAVDADANANKLLPSPTNLQPGSSLALSLTPEQGRLLWQQINAHCFEMTLTSLGVHILFAGVRILLAMQRVYHAFYVFL